jgi:hypothetical protein
MTTPFFTNLDMNQNRVRDAADAVLGKDYVTLDQLTAASPTSFSATFGDGVATTYNIVHSLGTEDLVWDVYEIATGDSVGVGFSRAGANAVDITMNPAPASNAFRVVIVPAQ